MLAGGGRRVRLARVGSSEAANSDAAAFAAFLFATSTGRPATEAPAPATDETVVYETDAGAAFVTDPTVLVVRGSVSEEDVAGGRALGDRLAGTIATDVAPGAIDAVGRDLTNGGLRPMAVIAEDRMLAAPCVADIQIALGAEILYSGDNDLEVIEDILIAPVYADPARPHFRRFESKAVLAPFNKTDLHLVAIETQAACLVITGGGRPSPYVVDRAQGEATTVLLTRNETPQTLASLADVWMASRFAGERKAAAILEHLQRRLDLAALLRRVEG
jgi:BioD-like phosphotransacetylase family protein